MLTRFLSDKSHDALNVEYPFDNNLDMGNIEINVDGNLNYNIIPSLKKTKDIKANNYTLGILTRNDNLNEFLEFSDNNTEENELFYIYSNPTENIDTNARFWQIAENDVYIATLSANINIRNIFKIDFLDENNCKIYHEKNNLKYILAYSLSIGSVSMIPLTANNIDNYSTNLNYILNDNKIIFYVQSDVGNYALENNSGFLKISFAPQFQNKNNFYLKKSKNIQNIKNINNWISYKNTFNKNNLDVGQERSHFNIKNNQLFTSTINSIVSSIPVNIMTLKNQLNQENDQSRGNVFLNENETNLKEYESIFLGGKREFGYDKINLGSTLYTTPFIFKSGKTTYFHVPHDIYPYEKLNVNSSKLAESGAVGGNCPINSDKIWKKLKNYRDTSPYSIPREENNGQWLCTWLSAGNPNTRPVWMDRYYKPSRTTPYVALSAVTTEIIYKDSFECLDLKEDVSDVKSSLTFEKGVYYAYMHLGKNDYENMIVESLSSKVISSSLNVYKKTNFLDLEVLDNEYIFDGKTFGYLESDKNFEKNNATFSFFLEKEDWDVPSGNLVFGNYINKGFGFYNYFLTTPYTLLKMDQNTLKVLNNNFLEIENLSTKNLTLCSVAGVSRRNGFENIHILTDDFRLIEMDLRGTIVDSNSALRGVLNLQPSDKILSVTNDNDYCYVATPLGIGKINLNNNIITTAQEKASIGSGAEFQLLVDDTANIYKVYGEQPIIREQNIYCLSGSKISTYSTTLSTLSTFLETNSGVDCFNITKEGEINVVTKNEFLVYENGAVKNKILLSNFVENSLSAKQISYCEKFEYGKLLKYKIVFCKNNSDSYVYRLDSEYNQTTFKLNDNYDLIQNNLDITNYNHNIQCLGSKYNEKTYNFKVILLNKVNSEDFKELMFIVKSSDISTGKRHFLFTFDCYNGVADFYLDGQIYQRLNFEKRKYSISNTFNERIFYGSNGYFNGVPAFKYLKDVSDFVCSDFKLSENYIINKYLDQYEVIYFYSKVFPPSDIVYNMPSGTRNFVDTMEKVFNFNIPMFKSNYFMLNILNSGIFSDDIKKDLEEHIREKIKEYVPYYGILKGFEWLDTTSTPVVLEGDYNVSNTLTDII